MYLVRPWVPAAGNRSSTMLDRTLQACVVSGHCYCSPVLQHLLYSTFYVPHGISRKELNMSAATIPSVGDSAVWRHVRRDVLHLNPQGGIVLLNAYSCATPGHSNTTIRLSVHNSKQSLSDLPGTGWGLDELGQRSHNLSHPTPSPLAHVDILPLAKSAQLAGVDLVFVYQALGDQQEKAIVSNLRSDAIYHDLRLLWHITSVVASGFELLDPSFLYCDTGHGLMGDRAALLDAFSVHCTRPLVHDWAHIDTNREPSPIGSPLTSSFWLEESRKSQQYILQKLCSDVR